jgi:hypothetical protein
MGRSRSSHRGIRGDRFRRRTVGATGRDNGHMSRAAVRGLLPETGVIVTQFLAQLAIA